MINLRMNTMYDGSSCPLFTREMGAEAQTFHEKLPSYAHTPLVQLKDLAKFLRVKEIFVKDESKRFDLNAFKVLGGSYALGKLLAEKLSIALNEVDFRTVREKLSEPLVITTATAGNHGTGVAWAAREMGLKAVVFMPRGAACSSVERIRKLGAECIVTEVNYDDTVRLASTTAQEKKWTLVQDTAWEGYETIPTWISQGYTTMAAESLTQLKRCGYSSPTHLFLQAGVGAMAGGVLGYYADACGAENFTAVISEPEAANCLYQSIGSDSGERVSVMGDLDSIMAGLACGEVNKVTWDILKSAGSYFASVSDAVSASGMRILGNPIGQDSRIVSGESGAISIGLLYFLMTLPEPRMQKYRKELRLDENSVVLAFSTEGDTNHERYRKIVWEGAWSGY